LELRVDAQNASALALYRKCGFVSEGTIPFSALYGESWHTHHWMGKLLGPEAPLCADIDAPAPVPPRAADTIVLRRLRVGDASALWAWEQELFTGSPIYLRGANEGPDLAATEKRIAGASKNPHAVEFVACLDGGDRPGRIVGHAGLWVEPQFRMGHDGMLGVAVLPDYWSSGLGRGLAALAGEWAGEKNLRRLTCTTMAHNLRARRFAESLGFSLEVRCSHYVMIDGRAGTRLRYGKILQA
jgi:RimJ/RimL family protein N-acetyltransferase